MKKLSIKQLYIAKNFRKVEIPKYEQTKEQRATNEDKRKNQIGWEEKGQKKIKLPLIQIGHTTQKTCSISKYVDTLIRLKMKRRY